MVICYNLEMRIPLISILLVLVSLGSVIGITYGQTVEEQEYDFILPQVLLQIHLYNSEGHLVSYIEGTKIITIAPTVLDAYLDSLEYKIFISNPLRQIQAVRLPTLPNPTTPNVLPCNSVPCNSNRIFQLPRRRA